MRDLLRTMRGDRLEGILPKVYTGDRTDTRRFILAFDRYTFLNHTATLIRDPMKRASLFLGLLEGSLGLGQQNLGMAQRRSRRTRNSSFWIRRLASC